MNAYNVGTIMLRLRLMAMRLDKVACAGALLCLAGILMGMWMIPATQSRIQKQQQDLARMQQESRTAAVITAPLPPSSSQNLENFYEALGERSYAEQQIKTLFSIAGKAGINLDQAEYRWAYVQSGRYYTYQILLPVKGNYPSIRAFCDQVLLSVPFISLDQVEFKREAISSGTLEAQLRFTAYLGEESAGVHGRGNPVPEDM